MRPRWRLGMLMIAVAVAALALVAGPLRRRDALILRADYHAAQEQLYAVAAREQADLADLAEGKTTSPLRSFLDPSTVARSRAVWYRAAVSVNTNRAAYHAALRSKYKRAAARPWEWIAPDPPPPP